MKIKALAAAVLLGLVTVTGARALGLGAQLNFSAGGLFAPGAALAVSPSDTTHLAVNWYFGLDKTNIIGLTLDICPLVLPLSTFSAGSLNFTFGGGLYGNLILREEDVDIDGGLRLPLGFSLMLGRNAFEIYTHLAPSFGVRFLPSLDLSRPFFPIALGARFWFR
jgi:hypothetical protein